MLIGQLASADPPVRAAAALALARIGDARARDPLLDASGKESGATKNLLVDACLLLADRLCAGTNGKAAALPVYRKLFDTGTGHIKCGALIGLGRAGGPAELPLVLDAMADTDPRLRGSAFEAVRLLACKEATPALMEKLKGASRELKLTILRALADAADPAARPAFVAAAEDADEDIRVEGLRGLGAVGDGSVVVLLAQTAAAGGRVGDAARASLDGLAAKDANEALVKALQDSNPKVRAEAARSLGARHATDAVPALLRAAGADPGLLGDAMKTMVSLVEAEHLDALVNLTAGVTNTSANDAAASAVVAAALKNADAAKRTDPIVAACAKATPQGKQALFGALGRLGGPKALETLNAAASDADEELQKTAVRAMSEWPDTGAADALLNLARNARNEAVRILALRGYLRLAELAKPAQSIAMCQTALEVAQRPDEKRLALKGLGETMEPAALAVLEPLTADAQLGEEACAAIVNICENLKGKEAVKAKATLEKAANATKQKDLKKRAQELLDGGKRR